jgi:hypothetical protein
MTEKICRYNYTRISNNIIDYIISIGSNWDNNSLLFFNISMVDGWKWLFTWKFKKNFIKIIFTGFLFC